MKRTISLGMLFILILLGCKNDRISKLNELSPEYVGKIKISAGDEIDYILKDTLNFLAYPMNVAIYKGNKEKEKIVYVIGKSIRKDQEVAFTPFAKLTYEDLDHGLIEVALSVPLDEKYVTTRINNYFEFISINYGVQKLIEEWVRNAKGYGKVRDIQWFNEEKAKTFLEE